MQNCHEVEDQKKKLFLDSDNLKVDWKHIFDKRDQVNAELEMQRLFWVGKEAAAERTFAELQKRAEEAEAMVTS